MTSERATSIQLTSCLTVLLTTLAAVAAIWGQSVDCQFLQPQSHIGRLVQSIASPLVLSSNSGGGETEPSDSYDPELMGAQAQQADELRNLRHQPQNNQHQPETSQHYQHYQRQQQQQQQHQALEQAPSRGIPQRYYEGAPASHPHYNQHDDEDSAAPTNQHRRQPAANEQYQMGAYLGPTVDDKEIQGAFNSNDDRDDDDAPGYDGPPPGTNGLSSRQRGAANSYAASQPVESSGAYGDGGRRYVSGRTPDQFGGVDSAEQTAQVGRGAQRGGDFDDESNVDEDDEPAAPQRRPRRFRQSAAMSQAASQYHQRPNHYGHQLTPADRGQQEGGVQGGPMMVAANGYSPMGSNPFDLSSLMAAAAGAGANGQAYEVYNGDGSHPGYYPSQQQQGRHRQAASMGNPYGYPNGNQMDGGNHQNQNRQRGSDADDADSEADED